MNEFATSLLRIAYDFAPSRAFVVDGFFPSSLLFRLLFLLLLFVIACSFVVVCFLLSPAF
jgi:hypothetical protein